MAKKSSRKPVVYSIGEGGISYIDLILESPEVKVLVNQPGMLISELVSATDLAHIDGLNYYKLACFAESIEVKAYCGFSGTSHVPIAIQYRLTPQLTVGVGPTAMYQNELTIRTRTGDALEATIRAHLVNKRRRNLMFGLVPVFKEAGHHDQHMRTHAPHVHVEEKLIT